MLVAVDAGPFDGSDEGCGEASLVRGFDGGLRGNRTLFCHAILSPIDSPTASENSWIRPGRQGPFCLSNPLI